MENILFTCKNEDILLYDIMHLLYNFFLTNGDHIIFEENKKDNNYFYSLFNKKLNLEGYVYRDKDTKLIIFIIKDMTKISYAKKEGFLDNINNEDDIYKRLKIIKKLSNLQSFINIMRGKEII